MANSIGTLPGPYTGTCWPAAMTIFGPATSGTATEIPEIFRKSRRETPVVSELWLASFRVSSSSRIPNLRKLQRSTRPEFRTTGLASTGACAYPTDECAYQYSEPDWLNSSREVFKKNRRCRGFHPALGNSNGQPVAKAG